MKLGNVRVVLLAGGQGERFWPRSTPEAPKQFLRLYGNRSLLRATYERALTLVPPEFIYVATHARYAGITQQELPELPEGNLILEPEGRDTAASLGLSALWLEYSEPDCIMVALPADHRIDGETKFSHTVQAAIAAAMDRRGFVTLGVAPSRPESGYGYIQVGDAFGDYLGSPVHNVVRFVEKPNASLAAQYLAAGDYLWNSGIFVFNIATLRAEIARYLPELHGVLKELGSYGTLSEMCAALPTIFPRAPKVSIDYGVLEKSNQVYVMPAYFGWDDVGSWSAIERLRPRDESGNCVQGNVIAYDSNNLIIEGGHRLIAAVGVSDLIVVDTPETILICAKSRAQDVKKVAAKATALPTNPKVPAPPNARVVLHPWGQETCWSVTDQHIGKILQVREGQSLDLQSHEQTTGSLYCQAGNGRLRSGDQWLEIGPGSVLLITPGTDREIVAVTDLTVVEIVVSSTVGMGQA